jgi:hypothetical protein
VERVRSNRPRGRALLTDLDQHDCPSQLIAGLLNHQCHVNFLFRVAVSEVESWALADREGFAQFLGISSVLVPAQPDHVADPKQTLINLARRSRRRTLKAFAEPKSSMAKGHVLRTSLAAALRSP